MTLSIKNDGYAFLIRLDLFLSMSLWKEFQLLEILNDLSTRHLIKLILYENDFREEISKISKISEKTCIGHFVIFLKCKILIIDTWNEYIKKSDWMVNLSFFFIVNLMLGCLLFKKF